MIVMLSVPVGLHALYPHEPSLARAVIAALSDEKTWALPPAPASGLSKAIKMHLPSHLQTKTLAELGDVLARVMHAHEACQRTDTDADVVAADAALPLPLSVLQKEMLDGVLHGIIGRDKIVFAEGSTGLGKTRVICYAAMAAANAAAAEGSTATVVITVPTVALIAQVMDTFNKLETGITPAVLLGRGQFIDPDMVSALIDEPDIALDADTVVAVRQWIAKGDAQVKNWIAKEGVPEKSLLEIPWLRDALTALAPDLPMAGLAHSREVPGRAETAYQAARSAATTSRVVITTHAMIASQIRALTLNQEGQQLDTYALFIDEAHEFAGAVESAFSDGLSLFALRHRLRGLSEDDKRRARAIKVVDRMLTLIDAAIPKLAGMFSGQSTIVLADKTREIVAMIVSGLSTSAVGLKRLDAAIPASIKRVADGLAKERAPAILSFSQVRHLPTITAGPRSLSKPLAAYWSTVPRAALFSGTLYAPTQAGWSADWVRVELAIPDERKAVLPRFIEPWVFEPMLHLPSPKIASLFIPPKTDLSAESAYFDAVSAVIRDTIHPTARGGTLVLCTSFTAINEISQRLRMIENLITQKGGGFASARAQFKQLRKPYWLATGAAWSKPIWLATGAAWTGLDLVALTDPADDFLLTDVVIVRIPFRFAETPLAQARFERLGMSAVRIDGSFKLRQGIGRLQRRKGCTNRRLWLLDGRLSVENPAHTFLLSPIKRVLADYKNTTFFGD